MFELARCAVRLDQYYGTGLAMVQHRWPAMDSLRGGKNARVNRSRAKPHAPCRAPRFTEL